MRRIFPRRPRRRHRWTVMRGMTARNREGPAPRRLQPGRTFETDASPVNTRTHTRSTLKYGFSCTTRHIDLKMQTQAPTGRVPAGVCAPVSVRYAAGWRGTPWPPASPCLIVERLTFVALSRRPTEPNLQMQKRNDAGAAAKWYLDGQRDAPAYQR